MFSFLLLLLVPAHAESINYNDYVSSVSVDGLNELVTVTIPKEMAQIQVFSIDGNKYTLVASGTEYVEYNFSPYGEYRVTVWPFGSRHTNNNGLDLSYIPAGTEITSGFGFDFLNVPNFVGDGFLYVDYLYFPYDSVNYLARDTHDYLYSENNISFRDTYTLRSVDSAKLLNVEWYYDGFYFFDESPTGVHVNDTVLTFSISSLIRQQQLTGETNELLDEVSSQLEEQGKKLDDIINYTPSGSAPDGSEDFSELHNQEDQLLGDVQNYLDSGLTYFENASGIVIKFGEAFQAWKLLTSPVFRLPFANDILTVSVSLGLIGTIVGLVSVASSSVHRRDRKTERKQAKRESANAKASSSSNSKKG